MSNLGINTNIIMSDAVPQEARKALAWLRNTSPDDKTLEEEVQLMEIEEEYSRSVRRATWKSIGK